MKDSGNAVGAIKPKVSDRKSGTTKSTEISRITETASKPRGKQSEDYTGFRSSHLTAIEPVLGKDGRKDYKGYTIWHCKCDCGRYAEYESRALRSGRAKDCGDDACPYHVEAIRKRYRFEDFTGRRFGKLVVIGPVMKDSVSPDHPGTSAVDNYDTGVTVSAGEPVCHRTSAVTMQDPHDNLNNSPTTR